MWKAEKIRRGNNTCKGPEARKYVLYLKEKNDLKPGLKGKRKHGARLPYPFPACLRSRGLFLMLTKVSYHKRHICSANYHAVAGSAIALRILSWLAANPCQIFDPDLLRASPVFFFFFNVFFK